MINEEFEKDKKEFRKYLMKNIVGKRPKQMNFWHEAFFDPDSRFTKREVDDLMLTIIFPEDIDAGYQVFNSIFEINTDLEDLDFSRSRGY